MSETTIPDVNFGAGDGDDVGDTPISTNAVDVAEVARANRADREVNSTVNSGHDFGEGAQEPVIPPLEPGEGAQLEDTFDFGAGGEGGEDTVEVEAGNSPLAPAPRSSDDEPPARRPAAKAAAKKAPARKAPAKAPAKKAAAKKGR